MAYLYQIIMVLGSLEKGRTGAMGYERRTGEYYVYQNQRIDASYHGTGDLFSSTCAGATIPELIGMK